MEKLYRVGRNLFIASAASLFIFAVVILRIDETPIEGTLTGQLLVVVPFYVMLFAFIGGVVVTLVALVKRTQLSTKNHA